MRIEGQDIEISLEMKHTCNQSSNKIMIAPETVNQSDKTNGTYGKRFVEDRA